MITDLSYEITNKSIPRPIIKGTVFSVTDLIQIVLESPLMRKRIEEIDREPRKMRSTLGVFDEHKRWVLWDKDERRLLCFEEGYLYSYYLNSSHPKSSIPENSIRMSGMFFCM